VLIAIGNSGEAGLAVEAERLLDDESPLVRGAAVWAFAQLMPAKFAELASASIATESDESVREEWRTASQCSVADRRFTNRREPASLRR
jgi:epoxyqueuosine reductase